jgi:hypothetical protein
MLRMATPLRLERISHCRGGQGTAIASIGGWRGPRPLSTAARRRINELQDHHHDLHRHYGLGAITTAGQASSPSLTAAVPDAANDSRSPTSAPGRGFQFRLPAPYKQRRVPSLDGKQALLSRTRSSSVSRRVCAFGNTFTSARGVHTVASIVHPTSGRTTSDLDTRRPYSSSTSPAMYTASFAFFEALWDAGVTHCFVNLGSDHPSIIEAMVKGQREKKGKFPRIITCPNEVSRGFISSPKLDRRTCVLSEHVPTQRWLPCPWPTATPA